MKKILLLINYSIAVFALFALWGCDDGSDLYESEFVVFMYCSR